MDEIVCANTAFRYWRCPPQVRDLYPRLPSPEDGWRALAQSPFVVDVLKTPVITAASTRSNLHSDLRHTIRWNEAYAGNASIDTGMGFSVTDPLNTLFTMTRSISHSDLVLAMYEFCGWFSISNHLLHPKLPLYWQVRMKRALAPISYLSLMRPRMSHPGSASMQPHSQRATK